MNRQINLMVQESLQIDFSPQPRGIAVVTSAPISSIVEGGNYSTFQDLIDGYASAFAKVFVLSPSGESTVVPNKAHRVTWLSGPSWLSQTQGLLWAAHQNRHDLKHVELIRSFGPRAGAVGRVLTGLSKSHHVSSVDDLVGNHWRERQGWRSFMPKLITKYGVLGADVISATFDWELELLADSNYMNDLLLGSVGLPTDLYTPVNLTDPNRHPVVLWAGNVIDDKSISALQEAATSTRKMIDNVEFVAVVQNELAVRVRTAMTEHDLPVTVVSFEEVEPLVDLIERTWVCVTTPSRGYPHGLAMLALSAGIPLISTNVLKEKRGFKSHLNYVGIEPGEQDAVANALQSFRQWGSFAHRIGTAGQRLIEERFSTRSVGITEGERLARIATDQSIEPETARAAAMFEDLKLELLGENDLTEADAPGVELVEESIQDVAEGFDLVAAAIAAANDVKSTDLIARAPEKSETVEDSSDKIDGADLIAGLFDESSELPVSPEPEMVSVGEADDPEEDIPEIKMVKVNVEDIPVATETTEEASGDMGQDAISALFAASNDEPAVKSEPAPEPSGDMGQDAISALFAANNDEPAAKSEPAPEPSGDMGQDAISALFAANNDDPVAKPEPEPAEEPSGDMGQDAISALFAAAEKDEAA